MAPIDANSWIEEAALLDTDTTRSVWAHAHPEYADTAAIQKLLAAVLEATRSNLARASNLAAAAVVLVRDSGDGSARAFALRASGAAHYSNSDYAGAVQDYSNALTLFDSAGDTLEAGKTLNSGLQPLAYTGQYERAFEWAGRARQIFQSLGDTLRLARLDSNMANILYRQDRHGEAIGLYEEALGAFRRAGDAHDVAAAISNIAVCRTSLGQFSEALTAYREARGHCAAHGFPLLVAAADYNIAWLHYLRGDYLRAIELYAGTRAHCEAAGDAYHLALSDLDEAEIYLELNLNTEAADLARRAAAAFASLGMAYEQAKALVNLALAERSTSSPTRFAEARTLFESQKNSIWIALIDLHEAAIARERGYSRQALLLCRKARRVLDGSLLPGKAALCELLEASILLDRGETARSRAIASAALERLNNSESRAQRFQACALLARIEEIAGRSGEARALWREARAEMESLRSRLWGESSRISFLKDKLSVYESLARLALERGETEEAFESIEHAKSRSMAEMLTIPEALPGDSEMESLLYDLSACHRQTELAALSGERNRVDSLRSLALGLENDITRRFTALRSGQAGATLRSPAVQLSDIQAAIPEQTLLVEFYQIQGFYYVCLVSSRGIHIQPLSPTSTVRPALRLLELQIARVRESGPRAERLVASSTLAAQRHLRELHDALIAPIANELAGYSHLVVVPHGLLHQAPIHAFFDGDCYLTDRFTMSYAPSASVFARSVNRGPRATGPPLVMGIPDSKAPWIESEARAVAEIFPGARLLLKDQATGARLREWGPESRYVHIAAHGVFRRDNALFSSIRLGDSSLSLLDFYRIPLAAELVTLSGCGTGLNAVVGGDELIGLIRGLLFAGARSVVASLWDVNDESAAVFMTSLYRKLQAGSSKSVAVRQAMREVREKRPHPCHWAPFILVGPDE
jgi:CHAT domain-containing protein/tetratricopeptide (TPR) repeat protein